MATAGDLVVNLTANSTKFTSGLNQASGGISSFVAGAASKLSILGLAMQGVQAAGRIFGALKMPLELAANAEQTQVAFATLLGSADAAKRVLSDLERFGAATPFQTDELNDAGRKLLAFGTTAEELIPTLRAIGDVSSGVQAPIGEIAEIFGKAKVAGALFSEDINQLVGRGIPVIQEFAKQLGVSEAEVKQLASEGKISFANLQQAFADLTGEGGKFEGMMAAQSRTVGGLWSTIKDTATSALKGIGAAILEAFDVRGGLEGLVAAIGPMKDAFLATIQAWVPAIRDFVATVKTQLVAGFGSARDFAISAWDAIGQPVLAYAGLVAGQLSALWQMMREGFSAVAAFAVQAWQTVFGGSAGFQDLTQIVTEGLIAMEFGWRNWKELIQLATTSALLQIVTFGAEVSHLFTGVIPALLAWFGQHWKSVFLDVFDFTTTAMGNLNANLARILLDLPGLLRGTVSFDDVWRPLTEGFESAISELPKIPERQRGPLEQSLADDVERMGGALGGGYSKFRDDRLKEIAGGQKTVGDFLKNGISLPTAKVAESAPGKTLGDFASKRKSETGQDEASQAVPAPGFAAAVIAGSKEAYSAIAAAMRLGRVGKDPAQEQLAEQKKTNEHLERIARNGGVVGGGLQIVENFQ